MNKKNISKGKRKSPETQEKNIKWLPLALGILLMVAGVIGISLNSDDQAEWSVSDEGILSYSLIEDAQYSVTNATTDGNDTVRTVSFTSRGTEIQGLIRIPSSDSPVPGVVILPGAGVSKEKQKAVPELLSELGYASITIDQRNMGGIDPQTDLELYMAGEEPVEYMMTYDALEAANVLGEQEEVDEQDIAMIGLSNGGRFAIIATAINPDIKGVIAISTSGYDTDSIVIDDSVNMDAYRFYRSIDPDTYVQDITPRRFVMMHSQNDSIIPYELATRTFNKAEEPKALYTFNGSTHGYSQEMVYYLQQELENIL